MPTPTWCLTWLMIVALTDRNAEIGCSAVFSTDELEEVAWSRERARDERLGVVHGHQESMMGTEALWMRMRTLYCYVDQKKGNQKTGVTNGVKFPS